MRLEAEAAIISRDPGLIFVGFQFAGDPGYLILTFPADDAARQDLFDGAGHSIEYRDQLYGQLDGVLAAAVDDERTLHLRLNTDARLDIGAMTIITRTPISDEAIALLRQLPS